MITFKYPLPSFLPSFLRKEFRNISNITKFANVEEIGFYHINMVKFGGVA